jgi:hypothetical protein
MKNDFEYFCFDFVGLSKVRAIRNLRFKFERWSRLHDDFNAIISSSLFESFSNLSALVEPRVATLRGESPGPVV